MSKKIVSILVIGLLAVAGMFAVAAYRTANAQTPTPAAPTTNDNDQGGFHKGWGGGSSDTDLANALGITTDQLTAAYQKANDAALTQAVTNGLITQAQADDIRSKGSAFPLGGRWSGWLSQKGIDYNSLLANALGITADKLQAAYTQEFNTKIDAAVTAGKLTQDQADLIKGEHALHADKTFQSAMQSAYTAAVNQAVTNGVITQAQADAILKNKSTMMGGPGFGMGMFDGGMGGPMMGGREFGKHGGWGGGGGWGGEKPGEMTPGGTPNAPTAPTATPSAGL